MLSPRSGLARPLTSWTLPPTTLVMIMELSWWTLLGRCSCQLCWHWPMPELLNIVTLYTCHWHISDQSRGGCRDSRVFSPALAHACIDSVLRSVMALARWPLPSSTTLSCISTPREPMVSPHWLDTMTGCPPPSGYSQTQCQKPRSVSGDKTLFKMLDYALFLQVYKETVSFPSLGRGC